jgi:hypothetical protein
MKIKPILFTDLTMDHNVINYVPWPKQKISNFQIQVPN